MQAVKLLVLVVAIAVIAVSAPKLAPGLVASLLGTGEPVDVASAPARAKRDGPASPASGVNRRRMILQADPLGHFQVEASINGRPVTAMVDTGASTVALSAESARRIGINPPPSAFTVPISTANGTVSAAQVTLRDVRVGGITVRNIAAVVVPDGLLRTNLLGMNFLGRLSKFELSGSRLVLFQ